MLASLRDLKKKLFSIGFLGMACIFFDPGILQAEIRTYVDKDGIIHIEGVDGEETSDKKESPKKAKRTGYVAGPTERKAYANYIKKQCVKYGLDSELVRAIIKIESDFNPYCVSPAGAEGIMQLMPDTAKRFSVQNSFDPYQNITGGIQYLRYLFKLFNNDVMLAVAAYNAGENAVFKHQGIPPYKETQAYVKNVMSLYKSGYYNPATTKIKKNTKKLYTYYNSKGILVITTKKPSKK